MQDQSQIPAEIIRFLIDDSGNQEFTINDELVLSSFLQKSLKNYVNSNDSLNYSNILNLLRCTIDDSEEGIKLIHNKLVYASQIKKQNNEMEINNSKLKSIPVSFLGIWYRSFSRIVTLLESKFTPLIELLFEMPWITLPSNIFNDYSHLILNMVSAQTTLVRPILLNLIRLMSDHSIVESLSKDTFLLQKLLIDNPSLASSFADLSIESIHASESIISGRIHYILQSIISLVPTAPTLIFPLIASNIPNIKESADSHVTYFKNCLQIISYEPVLSDQIFGLLVECMVKLDVAIQVELDDIDDEMLEEVRKSVFRKTNHKKVHKDRNGNERSNISNSPLSSTSLNSDENNLLDNDGNHLSMSSSAPYDSINIRINDIDQNDNMEEGDDDQETWYDSDDSESLITPITLDIKNIVTALDSMMEIMFGYIKEHINIDKINGTRRTFEVMLDSFEKSALPTHRLRCVQFLWFFACSQDTLYAELFMGLLVSRLLDSSTPTTIRVSAAYYLGSFMARAKYLDISSVRACVKLLNGWAYSYVEATEPSHTDPDVKKYPVFYATVQSLIYVFCFKYKSLMMINENEDNQNNYNINGFKRIHTINEYTSGKFPSEMVGFQRVLINKFEPLRVCSKLIAMEFASIAMKLDLMYCYPYIERSTGASGTTSPTSLLSNALAVFKSDNTAVNNSMNNSDNHSRQSSISSALDGTNSSTILQLANIRLIERLDVHFPFDPLLLPVSSDHVECIYQEWENGNENDEDDGNMVSDKDKHNNKNGFTYDDDDEEEDDDLLIGAASMSISAEDNESFLSSHMNIGIKINNNNKNYRNHDRLSVAHSYGDDMQCLSL